MTPPDPRDDDDRHWRNPPEPESEWGGTIWITIGILALCALIIFGMR